MKRVESTDQKNCDLFVSESDEDVGGVYSNGEIEYVYISEYEKAALRIKEENRQLIKKLQIYRVRLSKYM